MADTNVKLSGSAEGVGVFHDWEYHAPERNRGANGDTETYKVTNNSGNSLSVILTDHDGTEYTFNQSVDKLEFTIHGAIEISDFSELHKLIYKAGIIHSALRGENNAVREQTPSL